MPFLHNRVSRSIPLLNICLGDEYVNEPLGLALKGRVGDRNEEPEACESQFEEEPGWVDRHTS